MLYICSIITNHKNQTHESINRLSLILRRYRYHKPDCLEHYLILLTNNKTQTK